MSRVLRFASESDLPAHLRPRAQETTPVRVTKARKPRRDEEHESQVNFFLRLAALAINEPRFELAVRRTHAIPNGGGRSKREAGRLKAEGVRKGVPDIFCAIPQGSFHGLYIEMKSEDGRVSEEQDEWLLVSRQLGYAGSVCRSSDEAFSLWKTYVEGSVA